jgi:hypothetical protein
MTWSFFVDIPHDMTLWFRDSFRRFNGTPVQWVSAAAPVSATLQIFENKKEKTLSAFVTINSRLRQHGR